MRCTIVSQAHLSLSLSLSLSCSSCSCGRLPSGTTRSSARASRRCDDCGAVRGEPAKRLAGSPRLACTRTHARAR